MVQNKSNNKMYISATEWAQEWGGKKKDEKFKGAALPFYCCALSLQPFRDPVCTTDGIIYDYVNIVPFLKKYHKDPATGKPMTSKDLIRVTFHKNTQGEYICPATFKAFTEHTHIVVIKTSGHAYSMDAIQMLNIKPKNWKCLVTGNAFTKEDIITIQDPDDPERRKYQEYVHIKEGLTAQEEDNNNDPTKNIQLNPSTQKIFNEIKQKEQEKAKEKEKKLETTASTAVATTTTTTAPKPASTQKTKTLVSDSRLFTCAGFSPLPETDEMKPKMTKKKGYVRLNTNLGALNFELHCDMVPLTCENFIRLCESGYYNNTMFHRLIPNFMVQGGDPTATGRGGESIWKKQFKDEFKQNLLHTGRGILSMANSGPNTNGSQFFITFATATHLNFKHSVFGRLVGGSETLRAMELVPADDKDRPTLPIEIKEAVVFVNPFSPEEMAKEQEEERQKEIKKLKAQGKYVDEDDERGQWFSNPQPAPLQPAKSGVGKYIQSNQPAKPAPAAAVTQPADAEEDAAAESKKRRAATVDFVDTRNRVKMEKKLSTYGDFSNW